MIRIGTLEVQLSKNKTLNPQHYVELKVADTDTIMVIHPEDARTLGFVLIGMTEK